MIEKLPKNPPTLQLVLDAKELSAAQIRMIKTINVLLLNVATTDDESDFFESSNDLLKKCASLIKLANFNEQHTNKNIAYADQAIELSIDTLSEELEARTLVSFDN